MTRRKHIKDANRLIDHEPMSQEPNNQITTEIERLRSVYAKAVEYTPQDKSFKNGVFTALEAVLAFLSADLDSQPPPIPEGGEELAEIVFDSMYEAVEEDYDNHIEIGSKKAAKVIAALIHQEK